YLAARYLYHRAGRRHHAVVWYYAQDGYLRGLALVIAGSAVRRQPVGDRGVGAGHYWYHLRGHHCYSAAGHETPYCVFVYLARGLDCRRSVHLERARPARRHDSDVEPRRERSRPVLYH